MKFSRLCLFLALLIGRQWSFSYAQIDSQVKVDQIYTSSKRAIVKIQPTGRAPDSTFRQIDSGTGVIVSADGYILTALHVIGKDEEWFRKPDRTLDRHLDVTTLDENDQPRHLSATVVKVVLGATDLVLLRINATNLAHAVVSNRSTEGFPEIAEIVWGKANDIPQLFRGQITRTDVGTGGDGITIKAPVLEGYSGSPIFGPNGKVIGILRAKIPGDLGIAIRLSDVLTDLPSSVTQGTGMRVNDDWSLNEGSKTGSLLTGKNLKYQSSVKTVTWGFDWESDRDESFTVMCHSPDGTERNEHQNIDPGKRSASGTCSLHGPGSYSVRVARRDDHGRATADTVFNMPFEVDPASEIRLRLRGHISTPGVLQTIAAGDEFTAELIYAPDQAPLLSQAALTKYDTYKLSATVHSSKSGDQKFLGDPNALILVEHQGSAGDVFETDGTGCSYCVGFELSTSRPGALSGLTLPKVLTVGAFEVRRFVIVARPENAIGEITSIEIIGPAQ